MNLYIRLSRQLQILRKALRPSYSNRSVFAMLRRWLMYTFAYPIELKLREWGEQKFLHCQHHGNAGTEMRDYLFRKLRLYVEGYLANIAYRYASYVPKQVPASTEARRTLGLFVLRRLGRTEEEKKGYRELARIYSWLVEERPSWHNPYWDRAPHIPLPEGDQGIFEAVSDEKKEKFDEITDRAERLDRIIEKRVEGRAQRIYDNKDLMLYD